MDAKDIYRVQEMINANSTFGKMTSKHYDLRAKYVELMKKNIEQGWEIGREHSANDDLLCALLRELGFGEVVDVYEETTRWFE